MPTPAVASSSPVCVLCQWTKTPWQYQSGSPFVLHWCWFRRQDQGHGHGHQNTQGDAARAAVAGNRAFLPAARGSRAYRAPNPCCPG
jgi:hypothetical protein